MSKSCQTECLLKTCCDKQWSPDGLMTLVMEINNSGSIDCHQWSGRPDIVVTRNNKYWLSLISCTDFHVDCLEFLSTLFSVRKHLIWTFFQTSLVDNYVIKCLFSTVNPTVITTRLLTSFTLLLAKNIWRVKILFSCTLSQHFLRYSVWSFHSNWVIFLGTLCCFDWNW